MQEFEIHLKNERAGKLVLMSWLMTLLNFLLLIYVGILQSSQRISYSLLGPALILFIVVFEIAVRKKKLSQVRTDIFYFIIIAAWLLSGFYIAAVVNIFLFLLQVTANRKLIVRFLNDRIEYPAFPKKDIYWQDLNNVMLKDGLLTIDLKNNRLIQDHIISSVNEAEFNEFCRQEMTRRKPLN